MHDSVDRESLFEEENIPVQLIEIYVAIYSYCMYSETFIFKLIYISPYTVVFLHCSVLYKNSKLDFFVFLSLLILVFLSLQIYIYFDYVNHYRLYIIYIIYYYRL